MSETDYDYECMRAELLGLPKPDKEDFSTKRNDEQIEDGSAADANLEEEIDLQDEQMKNVKGGLDEIGNILQTTQKKINRFKAVFGSVTTLLKTRVSAGECSSETSSVTGADDKPDAVPQVVDDQLKNPAVELSSSSSSSAVEAHHKSPKSHDIAEMVGSHISTLDSMIYKADEINAKMNHQSKQMRIFINK